MKIVSILVIITTTLSSNIASAAPNISRISGTIIDDGAITITGSGFGQHDLDIEWLGGSGGAIESGSDNATFMSTNRPQWQEDMNPVRFDNSRAYSHSKSLIADSTIDGSGTFGIGYVEDKDIDFAYVSYYVYFDNNNLDAGQWKMYRMMPVLSVLDSNTPQVVIFNKRNFGSGSNIEWRPQTDTAQNKSLGSTDSDYNLPNAGAWYRVEIVLKASSANGRSDGYGRVWVHKPGNYIRKIYSEDNMMSYGAGDNRKWRVHMFQNYQGNGYGNITGTKVWMDDIYIAHSQARVEICDQPIWTNCTKRDIQYPTSWSDGEITIKLNQGGFSSFSNLYLYVVDGNGNANLNGIALTTSKALPLPPSEITATKTVVN